MASCQERREKPLVCDNSELFEEVEVTALCRLKATVRTDVKNDGTVTGGCNE